MTVGDVTSPRVQRRPELPGIQGQSNYSDVTVTPWDDTWTVSEHLFVVVWASGIARVVA